MRSISVNTATVPGKHKSHSVKNWKVVENSRVHAIRLKAAKGIQRDLTRCTSSHEVLQLWKDRKHLFMDHINYAGAIYFVGRKRWLPNKPEDTFVSIMNNYKLDGG